MRELIVPKKSTELQFKLCHRRYWAFDYTLCGGYGHTYNAGGYYPGCMIPLGILVTAYLSQSVLLSL